MLLPTLKCVRDAPAGIGERIEDAPSGMTSAAAIHSLLHGQARSGGGAESPARRTPVRTAGVRHGADVYLPRQTRSNGRAERSCQDCRF